MPKSRRRKGKFSPQRRQGQLSRPAAPQSPPMAAQAEPVARPRAISPSAPAPAAKAAALPTTVHSVTRELRTIVILAGTLLVAVIVVALFLA